MTDTQTPQPVAVEQAEAIAKNVAERCHGSRKPGSSPQRYAIIYQAARLGAIDALAERARLTTDRLVGVEARDVLAAIVAATTVGKRGSCATRSKYGSYPSTLYHRAVAALAATPPVPATSGEGEKMRELIGAVQSAPVTDPRGTQCGVCKSWFGATSAGYCATCIRSFKVPNYPPSGEGGGKLREAVVGAGKNAERRGGSVVIHGSDWLAIVAALATPDAAPIGSDDADYSGYVEEGDAIPEGMKPWHGAELAPDDWDGGSVLFRDGCLSIGTLCHRHRWGHVGLGGDVIAYTPKIHDAGACERCNGEGTINVEDRPFPNDISPSSHEEPCPECSA